MTESDQEAIHTRLDYMEKDWNSKLGQVAESLTKMAQAQETMMGKLSDFSLITERSNQHGKQIDILDKRVDTVEKKTPTYDLLVTAAGWGLKIVGGFLILGILGTIIVFNVS